MKLSTIVKKGRKAADITLTELATRAGISPGYACRIEHGDPTHRPSDAVLKRLAGVLSHSPDDLFIAAGRVPPDLAAWLVRHPDVVKSLRTQMEAA